MNRTSKDSLFSEQLWTKLPNRKKKEKNSTAIKRHVEQPCPHSELMSNVQIVLFCYRSQYYRKTWHKADAKQMLNR